MDDDGVVSIAILAGLVADRILAQQTTAANRINTQTSYWQWQVTQQRIKYIAGPVTDATLNSTRSQTCSQWGSRNTGDRLLHVLTFRGLSVSVCWRVIRTKTTKPTERPLGGDALAQGTIRTDWCHLAITMDRQICQCHTASRCHYCSKGTPRYFSECYGNLIDL